jgi:hypothetical protein
MVLTSQGKSLLSKGSLRFCYWTPFDDEIDYQPYIANSGSLSSEQLSASLFQLIEDTPVREATTGYRNFNISGSDYTNVHRPIFTIPQGQQIIPRTTFPGETNRYIQTQQRKIQRIYQDRDKKGKYDNKIDPFDIGTERYESSTFVLEFSYAKDSFPTDYPTEGFHVRVLRSGTAGWTELDPRRDMSNDLTYNNDVRIFTGRKGG